MIEENLILKGNKEELLAEPLIGWCAHIIEEPGYCKAKCEDCIDGKCHRYEGLPKSEFDKKILCLN